MPLGPAIVGESCETAFQTPLQFYRLNFTQTFSCMIILWPSTCLTLIITTMYVGQTLTGVAILCELLHNSQLKQEGILSI